MPLLVGKQCVYLPDPWPVTSLMVNLCHFCGCGATPVYAKSLRLKETGKFCQKKGKLANGKEEDPVLSRGALAVQGNKPCVKKSKCERYK